MKSISKKGIAAILIVISIIILLIVFFREKDVPFKKIEFNSGNTVYNRDLPTYMDTIVLAGLETLHFKNLNVMIQPLKIKNTGDLDYEAYIVESFGNYFIFTKNLSRSKAMRVLPHELIHLEQYANGQIEIKGDSLIWNFSEIYNSQDLPEYSERPWEIEAFKRSPNLKNQIEQILYEKE